MKYISILLMSALLFSCSPYRKLEKPYKQIRKEQARKHRRKDRSKGKGPEYRKDNRFKKSDYPKSKKR